MLKEIRVMICKRSLLIECALFIDCALLTRLINSLLIVCACLKKLIKILAFYVMRKQILYVFISFTSHLTTIHANI